MNRRLSDRTLMYRNALIVALRTSRRALTATELVQHIPWTEAVRPKEHHSRCKGLPEQGSDCVRVMECRVTSHQTSAGRVGL